MPFFRTKASWRCFRVASANVRSTPFFSHEITDGENNKCSIDHVVFLRLKRTDSGHSDHHHHRYHETLARHYPRKVSGSSVLSSRRAGVFCFSCVLSTSSRARALVDPETVETLDPSCSICYYWKISIPVATPSMLHHSHRVHRLHQ